MDTVTGIIAIVISVTVIFLLVGATVMGIHKRSPEPHDICKHEGCGVVHSMPCEDAIIVGGLPFICERRYNHRPPHEADAGGWVASWTDDHPSRCNVQQRNAIVSAIHRRREGAPPFRKMAL